jgi:hypothetical protein
MRLRLVGPDDDEDEEEEDEEAEEEEEEREEEVDKVEVVVLTDELDNDDPVDMFMTADEQDDNTSGAPNDLSHNGRPLWLDDNLVVAVRLAGGELRESH